MIDCREERESYIAGIILYNIHKYEIFDKEKVTGRINVLIITTSLKCCNNSAHTKVRGNKQDSKKQDMGAGGEGYKHEIYHLLSEKRVQL